MKSPFFLFREPVRPFGYLLTCNTYLGLNLLIGVWGMVYIIGQWIEEKLHSFLEPLMINGNLKQNGQNLA